jgi:hypothetical protein
MTTAARTWPGLAAMALSAALVVAAAPAAGGTTGVGDGRPTVDGATQVTENPVSARAHAVPAVAVHPDNPHVLALVEGEAYGAQCALHVSTDAGLTWTTRPLPQPGEWPDCMYANLGPVADVTFAPDGTLLVAHSGHNPQTYKSRIFVSRSDDLGRSWDTTAVPRVGPDLEAGQFGAGALPSIAVDPDQPERVYVGWMTNNGTWNLSEEVRQGREYTSRAHIAVSTDGGESFGEPTDLGGDHDGWFSQPDLVVDTEGSVHAFFGESTSPPADAPEGADGPPASLWHAVSRDGGEAFDTEALHTREPKPGGDWLSAPAPAVDRASGDLYLVWEESPAGEPPFVAFMRSSDGGRSWSDPVTVNDEQPHHEWSYNQFFPSVAVAPNGRIDVAWYDYRNDVAYDPEDESNALQDVYASYSRDGGRSWAPNYRVSDRLIDRRVGVWDTFGVRGPIGVAATDEAMYVAWSDTRNGDQADGAQDVYATRARFAAPGELFAGEPATATQSLMWVGSGMGGALLVGGVLLMLTTRAARRRAQTGRAR